MPNYLKKSIAEITKKSKKLTELEFLLDIIPPMSKDGPWIAGGSLLRTYLNLPLTSDLDIFFKNEAQFLAYRDQFRLKNSGRDSNGKYTIVKEEQHSWFTLETIKCFDAQEYKIQLVCKNYYTGPCDLLGHFDLDICQFAYDGKNLFLEQDVLKNIDSRQMHLVKTAYPQKFMQRCIKYSKLGFNISPEEIQRFFEMTKTIPLPTLETSEESYAEQ
jgi:hypothetical protein